MSMQDYKYKRQAMCAAKQLGYGADVVARIKESESVNEISRILKTARERSED